MLKVKSDLFKADTASFDFDIKAIHETEASSGGNDVIKIQGYANTTNKDRAGDVIIAEAWEKGGLENYKRNPILLAFHNHTLPIGQVTVLESRPTGLWIEAEVYKGTAPDSVYNGIKSGILKTFSVGFRALEVDYDDAASVFVIKDLELLEISIVSVPCNQDSTFSLMKSLNPTSIKSILTSIAKPVQSKEPKFQTEVEKLFYMLHNKS